MRRFVIAATIAATACTSVTPGEELLVGRPLEFRRDPAFQWFRTSNGLDQPETIVIRDAAGWEQIWARIVGRHTPPSPIPTVDFSREMVVLVALGTRGTGGYGAEIIHVVETAGGIGVDYRAISPGSNCFTTQALTQPIDLVIVPRVNGAAPFKRHDRTHDC